MKKLVLTLAAASFAVSTFAQGTNGHPAFRAGNILLYGVFSYSSQRGSETTKFASANASTTDAPRSRTWGALPGIGVNITDNITVGLDGYYTGSRTTLDRKTLSFITPEDDQVKTWNYGVGPFVRYTWPFGEHFFTYGQFQAHYIRGRETFRTVTAQVGGNSFVRDNDYKGVDASFMPAFGIMVNRAVALSFGFGGVGYAYQKFDNSTAGLPAGSESTSKNNQFFVTFGSQFNVGIQTYFGPRMSRLGGRRRGGGEMMDDTRRMDREDESESDDSGTKKRNRRRNDDE